MALGIEEFDEQKFMEAIPYFNEVGKNNGEALFYLGACYEKLNNQKKASHYSRQAILKGHKDDFMMGKDFFEQENIEKAIFHFKRIQEKPEVLFLLGKCYNSLEKYEQAEEYFIKASDKGYEEAYLALGHIYFKGKKFKEALNSFEKLPDEPEAHFWLGKCYRFLQNDHRKNASIANDHFLTTGQFFESGICLR